MGWLVQIPDRNHQYTLINSYTIFIVCDYMPGNSSTLGDIPNGLCKLINQSWCTFGIEADHLSSHTDCQVHRRFLLLQSINSLTHWGMLSKYTETATNKTRNQNVLFHWLGIYQSTGWQLRCGVILSNRYSPSRLGHWIELAWWRRWHRSTITRQWCPRKPPRGCGYIHRPSSFSDD